MAIKPSALFAGLLLASASLQAGAQRAELRTLQPGDTVKVWAVAPRLNGLVGVFDAFRADTLTMGQYPPSPAQVVAARVPYSSLRRVDVRRGTHRSAGRIALGVIGGAALGAVVGAYGGAAIECANGCPGDLGGLVGFVIGGATGIVIGGVGGGIIGARWKAPNWEPVSLTR